VSEVEAKAVLPRLWADIASAGDVANIEHGCHIVQIHSENGVKRYVSETLGQVDTRPMDHPGRWWGIANRAALPWGEMYFTPITPGQARKAIDAIVRATKIDRHGQWESLAVFDTPMVKDVVNIILRDETE
jgi:hypothetical protein